MYYSLTEEFSIMTWVDAVIDWYKIQGDYIGHNNEF